MTNLQRLREAKNFSRGQLSKLSGVSVRTIETYEQRPGNTTRLRNFLKLSKALNCKIEDLLEPQNESGE